MIQANRDNAAGLQADLLSLLEGMDYCLGLEARGYGLVAA